MHSIKIMPVGVVGHHPKFKGRAMLALISLQGPIGNELCRTLRGTVYSSHAASETCHVLT